MNRSTASLKHIISAYVAPRKFTFDFAAEIPKGEGVINTDLKILAWPMLAGCRIWKSL
jgi:hypothetical protein